VGGILVQNPERPLLSIRRPSVTVKTVGIIVKRGKPEAVGLARDICRRYPHVTFLTEHAVAQQLGLSLEEGDAALAERCELLVVLGGDGTLIHAARSLRGRPVPILGINLGRLGFMAEVPVAKLYPVLDDVLAGRYQLDSRMKLTVRLVRRGERLLEDEVLNDVVINKGALARIADHELCIDGEPVTTYKADGIIVATPTGSTAYSLSAGGPIVHPSMDSVIVSPICSHALTQRSIVVPPERTISIGLRSEVADVYLTIDGQVGHPLETGDVVEVQRSHNRVHLVRNPSVSYFSILREKLHWGL
jgi:NAD+ kinase